MATDTTRDEAIARVVESATRLGVELDEREAAEWVAAMETEASGGDLVVDVNSGVYGHRVTMLDFQPEDLARFREMATIVGFEDRPPQVLTALSISGSAAQSKINAYPADCDFFERVHITRRHARGGLRDPRRPDAPEGARHRHRADPSAVGGQVRVASGRRDQGRRAGRGGLADVVDARGDPRRPDGGHPRRRRAARLHLGGRVARARAGASSTGSSPTRRRGQLANASNVLDPTWEAPDGTITPLDGFLDPYYQEVYLEADSIPLFSKLVKELSADSVDDYVETLEHEVWKYTVKDPNYGKAARRMYNVFRMNGQYREAAFIRELFDEPVTALYQVAALIRTLDDAANSGDTFDVETMVAQCDPLIMSAIQALDGPEEAEMVAHLLKLRNSLQARESHAVAVRRRWPASRTRRSKSVNDYFETRPAVRPRDRGLPGGHRRAGAVGSLGSSARDWQSRFRLPRRRQRV